MNWLNRPDNFFLEENHIQIWKADLDVSEPFRKSLWNFLSRDEQKRAEKFRINDDCNNFIAARGILRFLLGRYLNIEPERITFDYGEYGKPIVVNDDSLRFNISHSNGVGLFAFTQKLELGVDIEFCKREIEIIAIAKRFFSQNEIKALSTLSGEDRVTGFYNCWTRKEAFIKAIGEGLSFPLDKFEVSLSPAKSAKLLAVNCDTKAELNWSLRSFKPYQNFIGALAFRGEIQKLDGFHVNEELIYTE